MRLLVVLALILATVCGFQIPFLSPHRGLDDGSIDELYGLADGLLNANSSMPSCQTCISFLNLVKKLSYLPESLQAAAMIAICKRSKKIDPEVCTGVIKEQLPVLRVVLRTNDMSGREGQLLCAATINACPYPDVRPWQVEFPSPKPIHQQPPPASVRHTFKVLHLSDWHMDPEYEAGADALCSKPICCRSAYTDPANVRQPASPWGAYTCDSPLSLIESMLEFVPSVAPKIEFGLLTGDVPPHEVWATLPYQKTQLIQDDSYALLHAHMDSPIGPLHTRMYPAIGNHDSAPTNNFPLPKTSSIPKDKDHAYLSMAWLYSALAKAWHGWISPTSADAVEHNSGSYVAWPRPGLRLITLNTNFCYTLNWWLYEQPVQQDPNGILTWLILQLQQAEDLGERVWINGHVAPGDSTCLHDYSNYYHQIVLRYAPHVIVAQFFGHTHRDEMQLFYSSESPSAESAISASYIAPSVTPYPNLNPGFRVYEVDAETFQVIESWTYIADLEQSKDWQDTMEWRLEYTASEAYAEAVARVTDAATMPLSPAWWHHVTKAMETDRDVFDTYWRFRSKSSPLAPACDAACQSDAICNVRAGKSELRCDYQHDKPKTFHEPEACSLFHIKDTEDENSSSHTV